MVRRVIEQCLVKNQMHQFVIEQAKHFMPKAIQEDFVQDVIEDLEQMDENRLAGLGVTSKQFLAWKQQN